MALKNTVIESAEHSGFKEEPWKDLESFESYCTNLGNMLAEQETESSKLIQFYGKLIDFVETLEVVHRLPRKQTKLNESLKAIILELKEQVDSDCPENFPYARQPKDWFERAFNLEGAELEALLDELEENFPELTDFLAECQWDWLKFNENDELNESKEETAAVVSDSLEIDDPELVELEALLFCDVELTEAAVLDDNDEPIELDDEELEGIEPSSMEDVPALEGQKRY